MEKLLLGHYMKSFSPGVTAFIMLYLLSKSGVNITLSWNNNLLSAFIVILASLAAIVGPLWYRINFIRQNKHRKKIPQQDLLNFQKRFISIASLTVYTAIAALLLQIPRVPFLAVILLTLYALYFYFPSRKRINHEKKLFRVNEKQ